MGENIINLLPENISNQIAAGEVVQRPSSVVKELLENSIDAKSTFIKLILKDSGKTLIQVIDDGIGMNQTDARMCFERHATSKIKSTEDLFSINTKGFRGEALASISAISHVELKTKQENSDIGHKINIEGGYIKEQSFCDTPKGTIFSIKNLFFNTPARRKFLKSDQIEYRHILDEFFRVAMAHPEVGFYLENNNNSIFNLKKTSLKERIENLIGKRIQNNLIKVEDVSNDIMEVYGFIGNPTVSKKIRGEQFFFANNRFIKNFYLNHAVNSAFHGMIKENEYPSYFLFLNIDPKSIDINIHPTKTEIKFDKEDIIYSLIKSAVKYSLGKFNFNTIDFNVEPEIESELLKRDKNISSADIKVDKDFNPFELEKKIYSSSFSNKKNDESWKVLYSGINNSFENFNIEKNIESNIMSFDKDFNFFQYKNKYIILFDTDIKIINQRLAHKTILYKKYSENKNLNVTSFKLVFPHEIEISEIDKQIVLSIEEELRKNGFDIIVKDKIIINSIPVSLKDINLTEFINGLINDYNNFNQDLEFIIMDYIWEYLAELNSIKSGDKLSKEEIKELLQNLFLLDSYQHTKKGEKIYMSITENDIINKIK